MIHIEHAHVSTMTFPALKNLTERGIKCFEIMNRTACDIGHPIDRGAFLPDTGKIKSATAVVFMRDGRFFEGLKNRIERVINGKHKTRRHLSCFIVARLKKRSSARQKVKS